MKNTTALGALLAVALAAVVLLAAGCSPVSNRVSLSPNGSTTELTFTGLAAEPDTLNPMLSSSTDVVNFTHLFMPYMVEVDDRNAFVPEVAQAVPTVVNGGISADGKTIIYHLRSGLTWDDGAPLTARDVVFTFGAIMNPNNNTISRVGYDRIASVEAKDSRTVVVHMKRAFSPIVAYFMAHQGNSSILPAHLLARYPNINRVAYNSRPVGAGAFSVVAWRHNDRIVLQANPRYWRGKPRIERLVFKLIPNSNTAAMQVRASEVDAYFGVNPSLYGQLSSLPGYVTKLSPIADIHDLHFNLDDPVTGDVAVRRALELAINRPKLLRQATLGINLLANGDQPSFSWAYDAQVPQAAYDPKQADALLDADGWTLGADGVRTKHGHRLEVDLSMAPAGVTASRVVANVVQEEARQVGINITIKQYPIGLFWGRASNGGVLASGKYQLAYNAWITGPDPDDSWQFACDQFPPRGQNFYFWCDPRADAAIEDALTTFDIARRKRDYAIVQREIATQVPIIPLWEVRRVNTYTRRLHGFAPSPTGSTFWNAWQWSLR